MPNLPYCPPPEEILQHVLSGSADVKELMKEKKTIDNQTLTAAVAETSVYALAKDVVANERITAINNSTFAVLANPDQPQIVKLTSQRNKMMLKCSCQSTKTCIDVLAVK
jgi:Icc-related predicted phosphoesterase